jgi:hypothetical protein
MNLASGTMLSLALATTFGVAADSARFSTRPASDGHRAMTAAALSRTTTHLAVSASAKPVPKPPPPRLKLEVVSPRYDPLLAPGLQFSSGWPIALRASGPDSALGIAINARPVVFPGIRQTGYLVLANPDGCLGLPPPFFRDPDSPCATLPSDETYVEFTNDVDMASVTDDAGNPDRALALANPVQSGGPVFAADGDPDGDGILGPVDVMVGPETGEAAPDGVGFGADDDFPGLVLLSPTGPGLVLNSDFTRPAVLQQRNIAGFLNTVAYELNAPGDITTFTLSMVVPHGLVAPIMKIDDCVGTFDGALCGSPPIYQIDGGPQQTASQLVNAQFLYPEVLKATPFFELRAFLVSGIAPSVLSDLDHNGVVNAVDAKLAGYNVISNEQVFRVRLYSTDNCTGVPFLNVFYADLDHNGHDTSIFVCPAGPGQITKPPR